MSKTKVIKGATEFIERAGKKIKRRMTEKENKEFSKKFKELSKDSKNLESNPKQLKIDPVRAAERAEMDAFRMAERESRAQRAFTDPNIKRKAGTRRSKDETTKPLKFKNGGIAVRGFGKAFMKSKR